MNSLPQTDPGSQLPTSDPLTSDERAFIEDMRVVANRPFLTATFTKSDICDMLAIIDDLCRRLAPAPSADAPAEHGFLKARGALKWHEGDDPAEVVIRRLRDGAGWPATPPAAEAAKPVKLTKAQRSVLQTLADGTKIVCNSGKTGYSYYFRFLDGTHRPALIKVDTLRIPDECGYVNLTSTGEKTCKMQYAITPAGRAALEGRK